jgi:hypothetical protein
MRSGVILGGIGVLVLGGLLALVLSGDTARDKKFDASVMGVEALRSWLPANDIPVVRSHPRLSPKVTDLSLRILPLYDIDLLSEEDPPQSKEALARQTTQRDIYSYVFFAKIEDLPTLVVLPKWRTGFATAEVAHASLLIDIDEITRLGRQTGLAGTRVLRRPAFFETARRAASRGSELQDIALFHAQLFDRNTLPVYCQEVIGFTYGVLLINCEAHGSIAATHFLSDPDLLNNHGLSVADNAAFVQGMMLNLLGGDTKPVYLDTSTELLLDTGEIDTEARDYEREAEDLARFFAYPLSVLWALAAVVLGVAAWRGARRFGPPRRLVDDAPEATKTAAIEAKARLLRLSGNDGRMAGEFVQARLSDLATQTFGPALGEAGITRLFAHIDRRNAALGADLRRVTAALTDRGGSLPQTELHRQLETFRDLLERVNDGSGPISKLG